MRAWPEPKGSYERCPKCHHLGWIPCKCVEFFCVIPWRDAVDEGDWRRRWARDAETAAAEYAEYYDCNGAEYTIITNGSGEVWVRAADGTVTKWDISAEAIPTYYAHEKRSADQTIEKP